MSDKCPAAARIFLETDRLVFRRLTESDLENLVDLDSDPEVMRFLSGGQPTPRDVIERVVLPRFLASYERFSPYGYWVAVEKASGAFLGWFGLVPEKGAYPGEVGLGYRLRRSAWGNGYATEGARALIRWAFTVAGAERVLATTYEHNVRSRRVMEKAGMKLVRTFRMTQEDLAAEGTFQAPLGDLWDGYDVEYVLDREEWERREGNALASPHLEAHASIGVDHHAHDVVAPNALGTGDGAGDQDVHADR